MTTDNAGKKKGLLGAIWENMTGNGSGCCAPGSNCCGQSSETPAAGSKGGKKTNTLKVYDPPMCCSSGVCGQNVDNALVQFACALSHLTKCGIVVERWNLAQQPQAFVENPRVKEMLAKSGKEGLPFIFVNDELKISGRYPKTEELFDWFGLGDEAEIISGSCCSEGCCK